MNLNGLQARLVRLEDPVSIRLDQTTHPRKRSVWLAMLFERLPCLLPRELPSECDAAMPAFQSTFKLLINLDKVVDALGLEPRTR